MWNKSLTAIFFIVLTSFFMMNSVHARIILTEKTTYYTVKGKTGRELYASMLKNGPKLEGIRGHALAATVINYEVINIKMDQTKRHCRLKKFDIELSVKYIYPRWRNRKGSRSTTRKAWGDFEKVAIWHEKEHVKLARDFAMDYEKLISKLKLSKRKNCDNLPFSFKFRSSSLALKSNRLHKRFDRKDLKPGGRGYKALIELVNAK